MPAARESLLDAAFTALAARPWAGIRMVDIAASAGVSRQTLYNEFGSKDGLARALVRREADAYLSGVERALGAGASGAVGPNERLAAVAVWTVRAATENPLVRAVLTGCWSERLPSPLPPSPPVVRPGPSRTRGAHVARRSGAAEPLPSPGELLGQVRDRAVRVLQGEWPRGGDGADGGDGGDGGDGADGADAELARACETAARLALSYVAAPAPAADVARVVRGALA